MKIQFFSINALQPEQDQAKLDDFCSRHKLVTVEKQFVDQDTASFWSICISYLDATITTTSKTSTKRNAIDYREVLSDENFAVFADLRTLRKSIAENEGVPVYAVFTNAQLAEMVQSRITSITTMGKINKVGEVKLSKYSKPFLAILTKAFPQT